MTDSPILRTLHCPTCGTATSHRWSPTTANLCHCTFCKTARIIHGPHSGRRPDEWRDYRGPPAVDSTGIMKVDKDTDTPG